MAAVFPQGKNADVVVGGGRYARNISNHVYGVTSDGRQIELDLIWDERANRSLKWLAVERRRKVQVTLRIGPHSNKPYVITMTGLCRLHDFDNHLGFRRIVTITRKKKTKQWQTKETS